MYSSDIWVFCSFEIRSPVLLFRTFKRSVILLGYLRVLGVDSVRAVGFPLVRLPSQFVGPFAEKRKLFRPPALRLWADFRDWDLLLNGSLDCCR